MLHTLKLMNGENRKEWLFNTEEEADALYRAICKAFKDKEFEDDGSKIEKEDITQLKMISSTITDIASFTPTTWFTKETYPEILEWVYKNYKKN